MISWEWNDTGKGTMIEGAGRVWEDKSSGEALSGQGAGNKTPLKLTIPLP